MRISYPKEIYEGIDSLKPYLVYSDSGFIVKQDAPNDVKLRFQKIKKMAKEFETNNT